MARIKYAFGEIPLINQHGGYTFQPNKQGQSMFPGQKNGRWRYPAQKLRQQNLMKSVNIWRNQSSGTVSNWESFVTAYPQTCKNPDSGFLTAYQNFIKRNQYQFLNFGLNAEIITNPNIEELTAIDYDFTMYLDSGRLMVSCEFSSTLDNIIVSLFSSRILSPGQLYNGSKSRYMGFLQNEPPISSFSNVLYNNYAAAYNISGETIAPAGWHVPTYLEYLTLRSFVGGFSVGGALKSTNSIFWNSPNTGAANLYEFNAIGAGSRTPAGAFVQLLDRGGIEYIGPPDYNFSFHSEDGSIWTGDSQRNTGHSIRFVKDDSVNPGYVTDYDGNVYPTISIGSQVWTAVNFRGTSYNAGTAIPELSSDSAWSSDTAGGFCYWNNSAVSPFSPSFGSVDITENWINRFGILPQVGQKLIFKYFPMALNSGQFFPEQQIYLTVE